MPSLEGAPLPLMEVAVLLWNSTPHSVLRDGGQSEKSFQLPDSPPTGATELVFWAIMERGGERKKEKDETAAAPGWIPFSCSVGEGDLLSITEQS